MRLFPSEELSTFPGKSKYTSEQFQRLMEGVIAGLEPNSIVVNFGTSLPESTKRIAAAVEGPGSRYMDAPLGRTPSNALEGKLNIMAAGSPDDFARLEPVFRDFG
ncbi:NAD(P)-binding domain-containing protein [Aureimonas mangrovi]|uniref:NAD(P)-binding domain-containing protein n=1 Tax=Aureimonas mangrovi TaxID=2758041 RepID=UPI001AEDD026|nr:NAD(P)-binding domain-containing protein [Aureimonas mangrovi]